MLWLLRATAQEPATVETAGTPGMSSDAFAYKS